jgi:hypothetical protein
MPEEPLIFVEVALTNGITSNIQSLLAEDRSRLGPENGYRGVLLDLELSGGLAWHFLWQRIDQTCCRGSVD